MGGIFGKDKKSTSRITEQDQAVLKLKKQRDQLKIYRKKIHGVLEKDRELAKKLLQEGKKDRARLLLRKKKYHEGLLDQAEGQLDNIERLVHDLEFVQIEKQVLDGLKVGNESLKKANDLFSLDEIESIMEDTKEAIDKQKEIDAILHGQLSDQDEEDVLAELDQLLTVDEEAEKPEESVEEEIKLPDAPTDKLPEPEKEKPEKVALTAA